MRCYPLPVASLLERLEPDAVEVSDRFTLRSLGLGRPPRSNDGDDLHERLDRLTAQMLPAPLAGGSPDIANRRTAASYDTVLCTTAFAREEFDRVGATNVMTVPLGVDLQMFHPAGSARNPQPLGRPGPTAAGALRPRCPSKSVPTASIDALAALRDSGWTPGWWSPATVRCGPGSNVMRPTCRSTSPDSSPRSTVATLLASADVALAPGPHETFGLAALGGAGLRDTGGGVTHVGVERDPDRRQRAVRGQRPGGDRRRRRGRHRPARTAAPVRVRDGAPSFSWPDRPLACSPLGAQPTA